MSVHRIPLAAAMLTALVPLALAGAAATAAGQHGATVDRGTLAALNDSGVTGGVTLVERDGTLRVNLHVHGLEPGQLHVHHIHGFGDDTDSTCPPQSAGGADGLVSFAEGVPFYGPVLVVLNGPDDTTSTLAYSRTFTKTAAGGPVTSLGDLDQYTVVVHGLTVDGTYEPTVPVACAVLTDNRN